MLQNLFGMVVIILACTLLSKDRGRINFKLMGFGIAIQFILAFVLLKVPGVDYLLLGANQVVVLLDRVTAQATQFLFGYLAGGPTPFEIADPSKNFLVAFRILPLILVVSALFSGLFYLGILPIIIQGFAWMLRRGLKLSGPLGFGAAATIFLGTIEAPLIIKPYLKKMSREELAALICCTMATIAGTVLVLYSTILQTTLPNATGQLVVASIISVPAALTLSMIVFPIKVDAATGFEYQREASSLVESIISGINEGLQMILQIIAILLVLFAFVYLFNECLAWIPGDHKVTLQSLLGWAMRPVVWLAGVPWTEAQVAGEIFGTKVVLNEFVAYDAMARLEPGALSERSRLIMSYACCGFANFGSLGIVVGGLGSLLPERRDEVAELGMWSVLLGNLATLMTGAVVACMY